MINFNRPLLATAAFLLVCMMRGAAVPLPQTNASNHRLLINNSDSVGNYRLSEKVTQDSDFETIRNNFVIFYFPSNSSSLYAICLATGERTLLCNAGQNYTLEDFANATIKIFPDRLGNPLENYIEVSVAKIIPFGHLLGSLYGGDFLWKVVLNDELSNYMLGSRQVAFMETPLPDWPDRSIYVGGANLRCGIHFWHLRSIPHQMYFNRLQRKEGQPEPVHTLILNNDGCPPAPFGNFILEASIEPVQRLVGLLHGEGHEEIPKWHFKFSVIDKRNWLSEEETERVQTSDAT